MTGTILALDLSLSAAAVCAVPLDWDLVPTRVRTWTLPTTADMVFQHRMDMIARDVRTLAIYSRATEIWVEDVPRGAQSGHTLVELRCAVRMELWRARLPELRLWWAPSARKLLYGRDVPRGLKEDVRKAWLFEPLKLAGLQVKNHNEADAFCGANWALSEAAAPHLKDLLGAIERKPKRRPKPELPPAPVVPLTLATEIKEDFREAARRFK